ncbi:hpo-20 [Pristionchus pacificus]|uniref:Phosphatidylinositol-glycan biosynthesis class W protein n=1 Tax=Pristionchus pacificus TaxID=54126 RepID=A0A2A6B3R0_PRIPA|nr:hpo-20 [Pristionchus pacificus]|eukprot:PDM60493.1 hpo-20 [Pristionchus pacificus]
MSSTKPLPMHGDGGSQFEIFTVVLIPAVGILLRNLFLPWITHGKRFPSNGRLYWIKFLVDFIFIVAPTLLVQTVLADSVGFVHLIMFSVIALLLVFMLVEQAMVVKDGATARHILNKIIEEHHAPTTFLTYFRSAIFILVAIAVLGVDFAIFPRRFAKTETVGHSLMDVGVAAFIAANGLVPPLKTSSRKEEGERKRASRRFSLIYSSTLLLVGLGIVRTIVLSILGYPYQVSEYGIHWNFFYTLAVVNLVTYLLPSQFTLITATIFAAVHQTALSNGVQAWVLDETAPRDSFLEANREGICSLAGYIAIYYYSRAMGRFIAKTALAGLRVRSWSAAVLHMLLLCGIFAAAQLAAEAALGPPSRRLVNLPYILAMISMECYLLAGCIGVQTISYIIWAARVPHFGSEENPFATSEPCLMTALNKHPLLFFLVSNVTTGVVNISIRALDLESWSLGPPVALCLLFAHMLAATAVPIFLCAKKKQ